MAPQSPARSADAALPRPLTAIERLTALHLGRTLGLGLLLAGLLQYESWSSRVVLGRWSVLAAAAIGLVGLLFLASAIHSLVCGRRARSSGDASPRGAGPGVAGAPSPATIWLELALLVWGAAYLVAALDDPEAGGRLLELDLLGSHCPLSIGLEWLALAAASIGLASFGWRSLRPRAPGLYLLLLSCLALAVVGEGITRAVNVIFPETQGFPTASTELWMRRFGDLNALGYRDRERDPAKPAGLLRILVLGDSFTFAMGVDRREDRVSDLLEQELPARLGQTVEVLNAGRPYTHTLQQTEALDALLPYEPDLVVLLYVYNDIDYLRSSDRPSTALGDGGSILGRLHPMRLAYLNSFLVQQIYLRVRHVYWSLAPADASPVSAYEEPALVERHVADLLRLAEVAGSRGADVVVVPFNPAFAQSEGDHRARLEFLARARAAGLVVWPLEHVFDGVPYDELIVNAMDHHPNARANRILTDALEDEIEHWARARAATASAVAVTSSAAPTTAEPSPAAAAAAP
ncbi:MAG: SGNH/GDSL hydrolase family protein [Myxococcota bacterium]